MHFIRALLNDYVLFQHNRLREYKSQLLQLQQQLKKHQDQATDMKQKHVEWSTQLLSKLTSLREEKKTWMGQATALNSANLDLTVSIRWITVRVYFSCEMFILRRRT